MKYVRFEDAVVRLGLPEQLARMLLEHEIVRPRPTLDRDRVISREEAEELRIARTLIEDLGVNLEGVEVILAMRRRQLALQKQFEETIRELRDELRRRLRDPDYLGPAGFLTGSCEHE